MGEGVRGGFFLGGWGEVRWDWELFIFALYIHIHLRLDILGAIYAQYCKVAVGVIEGRFLAGQAISFHLLLMSL